MRVLDAKSTVDAIVRIASDNGMTRHELSGSMNLTPMAVYNWQYRETIPSIDNLVMLTEILGVTLDDLVKTKEVANG